MVDALVAVVRELACVRPWDVWFLPFGAVEVARNVSFVKSALGVAVEFWKSTQFAW